MAGDEAAWLLPGAMALVATAGGAVELGGAVASATSGDGWRFVPFTFASGVTLVRSGTTSLWPGVDSRLVSALSVVVAAVVVLPAVIIGVRAWLRRPAYDSPHRSLGKIRDVLPLTPAKAALRAKSLRPSLAATKPKDIPLLERGFVLGALAPRNKVLLYGSFEDVGLALMAPRSMKTTALAVPMVLDAPGAVVATANKSDLWAATAALRERGDRRVWTFDPQRIARVQRSWWWNPLRSVVDGENPLEEAERLAGHFVLTVEDTRARDIWGPAASVLLTALILAAAMDRRSLNDVQSWLAVDGSPTPVDLLRDQGWNAVAEGLAGLYADPPETRGSVFFTARTATRCLFNPQITAWVTPPAPADDSSGLQEFVAERFPTTTETLFLMSKDGGGAAGPLVAALTDAVMRAGVVAAERRGGRLDPPMLVVLDEAANICKIADLPRLYSHLGSRGVVVFTILQSYNQGAGVWGDNGMKELWSAATIKLIGAGIDDPDFAEDISRLIGDHEVRHVSRNTGGERSTRTLSTRTQRVLPSSGVRALPKGTALLLATGSKPVMVSLRPWFASARRNDIGAAVEAAVASISESTPRELTA